MVGEPTPDPYEIDLEGIEGALELLASPLFVGPVGLRWRARACEHLHRRVDAYLRAGHTPFNGERHALAALKALALETFEAAKQLKAAAEALKFAGKGTQANVAIVAARRAAKATEGLTD